MSLRRDEAEAVGVIDVSMSIIGLLELPLLHVPF